MLEDLTVSMVIVYKLAAAIHQPTATKVLEAIFWLHVGLLLVFTCTMVCLALGIASNWPRCLGNGEGDDCPLGMACVEVLQTVGTYTRPLCNDCFYLADKYGTPSSPWAHRNAPGAFMAEANASRHCIEVRQ